MDSLTLIQPDDWHLHLRDGAALTRTVGDAAKQFARAIVMPNLKSPITTVAEALDYRQRVLDAIPEGASFEPLMTLYLTDNTTPEEIQLAGESPHIHACKLYPGGSTTNSDAGVTDLLALDPIFAAMAEQGLPLLIHGEVTDPSSDIFDREKLFIDTVLQPLRERFTHLKIVLEHITTAYAVDYIEAKNDLTGATITAHHLLLNRNDLLVGGIKPHHYCLPVLKRSTDQDALLTAATSGNPRFFLGTDSAPHSIDSKQSACGCAGIYTAFAALSYYAQAFEQANALDKLEGFASFFGADFYGLPRNTGAIHLMREPLKIPNTLSFTNTEIKPLFANQTLPWQVKLIDE